MPTAASIYRKRGLASAGRGIVDPRDIIPNLHRSKNRTEKNRRSSGDLNSKSASSGEKNNGSNSSSRDKKKAPFRRKSSGGLAVSLLAVVSTATATTTPGYIRRDSSSSHSLPRTDTPVTSNSNTLTNLFDNQVVRRFASGAASVKAKAASVNESGAAFLAIYRSVRDDSTTTTSTTEKKQSRLVKSSHGDFMKRALTSRASQLRKFTKNMSVDAEEPMATSMAMAPMQSFFAHHHPSYLQQLSPETPSNLEKSLGLASKLRHSHPGRPIYNGHYVRVRPSPLLHPELVIHSVDMAQELGLNKEDVESEVFLKYLSGDLEGGMLEEVESWATPYALSIMGRRYTNNCPYGTGDGYGDGRAISIGEVLVPKSNSVKSNEKDLTSLYPKEASRYELQLKGAGQTPFCRGADGRAVLRSSIREFLASEAMHHLGISTTRALSLTVSSGPKGNTSMRPWYSSKGRKLAIPTLNDPRLAQYTDAEKREIISQIAAQTKADPDTMVEERCAMTTRVARSFVRIGHLDLFARRVETVQASLEEGVDTNIKETNEYQELEDMMWHACYREYYEEAYEPYFENKDVKDAALALMEQSMCKIADMVAGWVRVGFVQGNFNADNCLVGGRTMDYGPFGFLDVYHPLSAKWTGSGDHFGFMNQPKAGYANFAVLVESLLPLIDANGGNVDEIRNEVLNKARDVFSEAVDKSMRSKMGIEIASSDNDKDSDQLWEEIEPLLRTARSDWTLFWRQLTYVASEFSPTTPDIELNYDKMLTVLLGDENTNPFYETLTDENRETLLAWLKKWHKSLVSSHQYAMSLPNADSIPPPEERMRRSNPKYTLREWMLVDAYTKADVGKFMPGEYSLIHELHNLSKDPYGEGTPENHKKYYRRAPDESLSAGGTAFMS